VGGLPTKQPAAAFAADPTANPVMFAALADGLWKSGDGGQTWQRLTSAPRGITALTVHSEGLVREVVFAGTGDGRIFRSADGGASWEAAR